MARPAHPTQPTRPTPQRPNRLSRWEMGTKRSITPTHSTPRNTRRNRAPTLFYPTHWHPPGSAEFFWLSHGTSCRHHPTQPHLQPRSWRDSTGIVHPLVRTPEPASPYQILERTRLFLVPRILLSTSRFIRLQRHLGSNCTHPPFTSLVDRPQPSITPTAHRRHRRA